MRVQSLTIPMNRRSAGLEGPVRMKTLAIALLWVTVAVSESAAAPPLLLQYPTLSRDSIAFNFANEIWIVPREGGAAQRLVTGQGLNAGAFFSPDGSLIAYTGVYDENPDVYVVPARGGEPKRLTFHPGFDRAWGWTPDGKSILFVSERETYRDLLQLYTVPLEGGFPTQIPLPSSYDASFSPDGSKLAYVPYQQWQPAWKRYRGGQTDLPALTGPGSRLVYAAL